MRLPDFLHEPIAGAVRFVGHRIALEHFVHYYNQGFSPEMLLGQFPSLSLPLIHKAIAFYLENQPEVDDYATRSLAEAEQQRSAAGSPDLAKLRRRLSEATQATT